MTTGCTMDMIFEYEFDKKKWKKVKSEINKLIEITFEDVNDEVKILRLYDIQEEIHSLIDNVNADNEFGSDSKISVLIREINGMR